MKPHWLITLSLTLLLAMACSKDEEATEEAVTYTHLPLPTLLLV